MAIGAGGVRLFAVLLRANPRHEHHSGGRRLLAVVRLWHRWRDDLFNDPLQAKARLTGYFRDGFDY